MQVGVFACLIQSWGERDYILVPMEDLMHDPGALLKPCEGVHIAPQEERVGIVLADLGEVKWQ